MAIQGVVTAVKDALVAGLEALEGSVRVFNTRVEPGIKESDFPLVVFVIKQTTGKAFFGGVKEDHFTAVSVFCFGLADKGSAALRVIEEAVYAALDRKVLADVAGYEGVQGLALMRGDIEQVEPNMFVCNGEYLIFGSVIVP